MRILGARTRGYGAVGLRGREMTNAESIPTFRSSRSTSAPQPRSPATPAAMRRSVVLATFTLLIAWTPIHAQVVDVWRAVAPGSERWTQQERTIDGTPVGTVVMNVVKPTLTAYLPERSRATGAGVIIAPGGAFVALATSLEGTELATWLQQRGVAAFLLKYR